MAQQNRLLRNYGRTGDRFDTGVGRYPDQDEEFDYEEEEDDDESNDYEFYSRSNEDDWRNQGQDETQFGREGRRGGQEGPDRFQSRNRGTRYDRGTNNW